MSTKEISMVCRLLPLLIVLASGFSAPAAEPPEISAERIRSAVAHLASDQLEGRGPGTMGEALATEYLADEFAKAGLRPIGKRDSYFQPV
ncbi:MAG TPA: hypothetical protein VL475_04955, partial [Planctomycetaceae bacterium]|nr:hypothetical protein [Planctomycetaceae bacterium]